MANLNKVVLVTVLFTAGVVWGQACCEKNNVRCVRVEKGELEGLLDAMGKRTETLRTYDANISSAFIQPLLEAQTVRWGKIYYVDDSNESKLRINFLTRQDDDARAQSDRLDYLFDGVWLVRVNYSTGHVEKRQIADEDEPEDVLGLVSENFPLIGFSNIENLKEEFEVELIDANRAEKKRGLEHVRLIPREESDFAQEYQQIDFWVDTDAMLPVRIDSLTVEEDIYRLEFEDYKMNKPLEGELFELEYPSDFTVEVKRLENS